MIGWPQHRLKQSSTFLQIFILNNRKIYTNIMVGAHEVYGLIFTLLFNIDNFSFFSPAKLIVLRPPLHALSFFLFELKPSPSNQDWLRH